MATPRKPKHLLQKAGRPTSYKPEYCQMLIAHMADGFSFDSFAADCDVDIAQLYRWADQFPEFCAAKQKGHPKGLKYWENEGKQGLKDKCFNTALWIFTMKNRFGYQEKRDPIEINFYAKEMIEENAKSNL